MGFLFVLPRMCRVECAVSPTEGVWGLTAPAGCRAEPYCFFPTGIALSEASVIPVGFFPFPIPWTKSVGFLFVLPRFSCVAYAFTFSHRWSVR